MKNKVAIRTIFGCILGSFTALVATAFSFAWFFSNQRAENQAVNGIIGLRDYFYNEYEPGDKYRDGDTPETAYEIVSPIHFYNLTRLQNLGIFSSKKYFKIGHNFGTEQNPLIKVLDDEGDPTSVLDMTSYFSTHDPFLPIGSESVPFYGEFDGQNIPVKGLQISSYPEDVGVFGYTACDSKVTSFICKNVTISFLGYSKTGETNYMYSASIEDIFAENAQAFAGADFTYDLNGASTPLKKDLVTDSYEIRPSLTIDNLEGKTIGESSIVEGIFMPHFLSIAGHNDFKYSLISSTTAVVIKHDDLNDTDYAVIDLHGLPNEFNDTHASVTLPTTISLVASYKTADGFEYSRVIQSYNIDIYQNDGVDDGILHASINCNFVVADDLVTHLNAEHGTNVGYLVGHADGNVKNCYVYNGKIVLNPSNPSLEQMVSQSETGLIGKIGKNVVSSISPTTDSGKDTGVLNISYLYDQIRTPFAQGDGPTTAGNAKPSDNADRVKFVAYAKNAIDQSGKYGPNGTVSTNFEKYKEYLQKKPDTTDLFITSAAGQDIPIEYGEGVNNYYIPGGEIPDSMNSIDFTWNKVVCDGPGTNGKRGLGVFRIVTNYDPEIAADPNLADSRWLTDLGDFTINRLKSGVDKIYFSTAECDWTAKDSAGKLLTNWSSITPLRMNTLPDHAYDEKHPERVTTDSGSFKYPFSRDFDYLFQIDLTEADNFVEGVGDNAEIWNYFYNTDSVFLQNYLKSILINKRNKPITSGKAFGLKIQYAQDAHTAVNSLTSYISIGTPKTQQKYTVPVYNPADTQNPWTNKPMYLPPKSITFSIDNPNGANVSVIGNKGNISIYKYNPNEEGGMPVELYSMWSSNTSGNNKGRYFEYRFNKFTDPLISGDTLSRTKTVVKPIEGMNDSNYLYAHIFKLPKGDYVIGASRKKGGENNTANLYYLSVQGQTNGDLGELDVATIGNYVDDVDFLLKDPTKQGFTLSDAVKANFSFDGIFTAGNGAIVVDAKTIVEDDEQTPDVDETVIRVQAKFNDCITYLLFYCRKNDPEFIANGDTITDHGLYNGPYHYISIENVVWEEA